MLFIENNTNKQFHHDDKHVIFVGKSSQTFNSSQVVANFHTNQNILNIVQDSRYRAANCYLVLINCDTILEMYRNILQLFNI